MNYTFNQCLALPKACSEIINSPFNPSDSVYCSQTKGLVWQKWRDDLNISNFYLPYEYPLTIAASAFLIGLGIYLLELYANKPEFPYGHANFKNQKTPWHKKLIQKNLTKTPDFECCKFMCLILTIVPLAISLICLANNP